MAAVRPPYLRGVRGRMSSGPVPTGTTVGRIDSCSQSCRHRDSECLARQGESIDLVRPTFAPNPGHAHRVSDCFRRRPRASRIGCRISAASVLGPHRAIPISMAPYHRATGSLRSSVFRSRHSSFGFRGACHRRRVVGCSFLEANVGLTTRSTRTPSFPRLS